MPRSRTASRQSRPALALMVMGLALSVLISSVTAKPFDPGPIRMV